MQLLLPKSTETYELVSTINHMGDFDFGHYTCSVKTDNSFKLFDDTRVKTVTQLKNDEAYVLFYKRVNASPPAIADVNAVQQEEEVEQNADGTDDQATPFKRNISSRTTPLNVKKSH
ncbi:hypothetical protein HA402_016205 [Bradysia odoriphaga]|nr:hypothetical protein HA402_016205 [Bradysia odoriphaga]